MNAENKSRRARYISAAIAIPFGIGVTLFSPNVFSLVATVFIAIGAVEFFAMARHRGMAPHSIIGTSCTIGVCIIAWAGRPLTLLYSLVASTLIIFTLAMARNARDAMTNIAVTILGVIYVGWLSSHIILLRLLPIENAGENPNFGGAGYVIMLLVLLWLGDGGAFFAGTGWGKHKLVPAVSPKKSVEGSLGGLAITLVGALLIKDLGILLNAFDLPLFPDWNYKEYLLVGVVIAVAGQIGDLCQSYLKRDADLKDTGNLFPGHGGYLDRFDSMIFAAPLFYFFVKFAHP